MFSPRIRDRNTSHISCHYKLKSNLSRKNRNRQHRCKTLGNWSECYWSSDHYKRMPRVTEGVARYEKNVHCSMAISAMHWSEFAALHW